MATFTSSGPVRFGVFEIDLDSGELRKQGIKIKLHDQPFRVLVMLVERPGQVITREELCQTLWPADTFVDSDLGLNSAVMKLRAALGDSAENPRFVETLPRRGYRLIVPVEGMNVGRKPPSQEPSSAPNPKDEQSSALTPDTSAHPQELGLPKVVVPGPEAAYPDVPSSDQRTGLKPRIPSWRKAALAVVILAVAAVGSWRLLRPKPGPYTIAVLPLKNLSPEPGSDYFSDGLTYEIISNLSVIDGLEVKSQTSSFTLKDKPRDIHSVGAQLGATLVLEGSVLRDADKLRVNVQLVRVSDDSLLWSGRFERELKDVFVVQDEISRSVVNELRLKLGRGQRRYNTNLEAYDLYLKARALSNPAGNPALSNPANPSTRKRLDASIALFEAAIAKDPNFAPAYAGIADDYAYMSMTPRAFSPEIAYTKMKESCEKALQLDPLLAEAHACMGLVHSREQAWKQAEEDFRKTFQLNPNRSGAHRDFAFFVLFPLGRTQEAEQELRTALKLDPLSVSVINQMDLILLGDRRYDEVLENGRRVLGSDPDNYSAQQNSARALIQKGKLDEGIAILEKLGKGSEHFLGYAYAKAGRRADAERIIAEHSDMPWIQAIVNAGLGNKDQALEGLEKMAAIKDPRIGNYPYYPELASLRGEPRLTELRKKQGLPDIR